MAGALPDYIMPDYRMSVRASRAFSIGWRITLRRCIFRSRSVVYLSPSSANALIHMPRTFQDIAQLSEFRTKELKLPELNVLVPDAQVYEILAIQPGGVIGLEDDFVGHA